MEPNIQKFDAVLFGGGISGLWTLTQLLEAGYKAILFEKNELGGMQTIASQGIIHGGTKYALTGKWTKSADNISSMPGIWNSCLNGKGIIDLSDVKVHTKNQLLWSSNSVISGLTNFFSTNMMNSKIEKILSSNYPEPFNSKKFKGVVFKLNEPVIDPLSLIISLTKKVKNHCFLLSENPSIDKKNNFWSLKLPNGQQIETQKLILTAGLGNQEILKKIGYKKPKMQTRPLHMLLLKGNLPTLYAHYLGMNASPRLTITTSHEEEDTIWYVGGQIAESGVGYSREKLISIGKKELMTALPWLNFDKLQWASLQATRAEIKYIKGMRPDNSFVEESDGLVTCWPTKLTLAPNLAEKVLKFISSSNIDQIKEKSFKIDLSVPSISQLPWQREIEWI